MAPARPLLVGLSGPSSSGKTTIARQLRALLPLRTLILHQDDFYRPEVELPFRAGHRDWDCAAAIDLPALKSALEHLRTTGTSPPDLISKEDRNDVGPCPVRPEVVARLGEEMGAWLARERPDLVRSDGRSAAESQGSSAAQLVLIDGFLLFGRSVPDIREAFDLRLMLRASYADAKVRRERRSGYVTLEGFWEDPPGYVDDVVWPGYVEEHAFLFKSGDVEGRVDVGVAEETGVRVCADEGERDMEAVLGWALEEIRKALVEQRDNADA